MPYQPALDGLRGIAVAAVLAYHAGFHWAGGGFLGVDAFFVLSGFLITGLLIAEKRRTGRIDLLAFWQRRLRRLAPALLMLLAGVVAYAAIFAGSDELARIRSDAFGAALYVTNWQAILGGTSYFAQFSTPSPLQHTWSLAIEEQWYIVWPLVVMAVLAAGRGSSRWLAPLCAVLALASAAWMAHLYDPSSDPSRVYYGTDTRAQSLLAGALLACLLARPVPIAWARHWRIALQAVGLAAAVATVTLWLTLRSDSAWLYQGGFLALAVLVAAVIAAATQPGRYPLGVALSLAPLRALGRISYGVYLVHWPLFLVLTPDRTGLDTYPLFGLRIAATIAIATCSYVLVERPVLAQSWSWSRLRLPQTLGVAAAGAAVVLVAIVVVTRGGTTSASMTSLEESAPPVVEAAPGAMRVLVVGDSVAYTVAGGLSRVGEREGIAVWNQSKIGCGIVRSDESLVNGRWEPESPGCREWSARWPAKIESFQPDVVVVLAGTWDLHDRRVAGETLRFRSQEGLLYAAGQIERAVDALSAGGARVVMLTTPRYQPPDLALAATEPRFDTGRIDELNRLYGQVTARSEYARVLDLQAFVERQAGGVRAMTDDGVHFTPSGAEAVARWLVPLISDAPRISRNGAEAITDVANAPAPAPRWREMLAVAPASASLVMNDYARFRAIFGVATSDEGSYIRALQFGGDGRPRALLPAPGLGLDAFPPSPAEALRGVPLTAIDADIVTSDGEYALLADGSIATLAGVPPAADATIQTAFDALALALEREGTYTAAFSRDTEQFEASEQARRIAGPDELHIDAAGALRNLRAEGVLSPFEAYATGAGVDEHGAYTSVILMHASTDAAAANALALHARLDNGSSWVAGASFASMFTAVSVRAEGPLVVAKLRGERVAYWYALHTAGDALLAWE